MHETLQEVKGDMIKAGLKWNKRTHSLFVDVHLLEGNTEVSSGTCLHQHMGHGH